jgi:ribokinase
VVVAAAERALALGAVVVHNPSPFRPLPDGMPHPGVLVVNEHEFALFGGVLGEEPSSPDGWTGGAVVVTRGAHGALVFAGGVVTPVAPVRVAAVDTSGCGDAFLGALSARLAAGASVEDAAAFAVRVGAFAATRRGTQSSYPTAADLAEGDAGVALNAR